MSISKIYPFVPYMKVLANFLSNPLASGGDSDEVGWPYVAFDLDPSVVKVSVFEHCAWLLSTSICMRTFSFPFLRNCLKFLSRDLLFRISVIWYGLIRCWDILSDALHEAWNKRTSFFIWTNSLFYICTWCTVFFFLKNKISLILWIAWYTSINVPIECWLINHFLFLCSYVFLFFILREWKHYFMSFLTLHIAISFIYLSFNLLFPFWTTEQAARKIGFPVLYGDGSRPDVLHSAGVSSPKAFMIMYTGKKKTIEAVQRLKLNFPAVIIFFPPLPSVQAPYLNWLCVRECMCTIGEKLRVSIIESNHGSMMWLA